MALLLNCKGHVKVQVYLILDLSKDESLKQTCICTVYIADMKSWPSTRCLSSDLLWVICLFFINTEPYC